MNIEEVRAYCKSKQCTTEDFPFDNVTLVFRVMGKIFALMDIETGEAINLKCDPEKAIELREKHSFITPGYHMNKKHWNTIFYKNNFNHALIEELIDDSYKLVVDSLTKKQKQELDQLIQEN